MIRPLFDRILIDRKDVPTMTNCGIIIPNFGKMFLFEGIVYSVGEGYIDRRKKKRHCHYNVGDRILFDINSGIAVPYEGKNYVLLEHDEIVAILGENDDVKFQTYRD